jgi:RimJ/RimL family protein N-acetyltransferase
MIPAGPGGAAVIRTPRLDLVPGAPALLAAALESPRRLGEALRAHVPHTWPPEYLDEAALRYVLDRVIVDAEAVPWWLYFVLLREPDRPVLIGTAGYKGPPCGDGTVEIGYGIVSDRRRSGYASEAASALVERAYAFAEVDRVIAETYPHLAGSIGVLERCGFDPAGEGSEPGVIRFALSRRAWERRSNRTPML